MIFSFFLVFSLTIDPYFNHYEITQNQKINSKDNVDLRSSDYWDNFTYIHLTGLNWSDAKNYGWVTGNGILGDPYILENMTIDATGSSIKCGIKISNSDYYFIIRNCTVYNAGIDANDAGIKLDNTKNGKLYNNTIFDCKGHGIFLNSCDFNNLTENTLINNRAGGIILVQSDHNNVSRNKAFENDLGIILTKSSYCNLTENNINQNIGTGILVENSNYTFIDNNTLNANKGAGITLTAWNLSYDLISYCINNTISNNRIINGELYGIEMFLDMDTTLIGYLYNNTISGNSISNNYDDAIHLRAFGNNTAEAYMSNNIIKGNKIINNRKTGVFLVAQGEGDAIVKCINNTISNNNIHENVLSGIHFKEVVKGNADVNCCNNTIINNELKKNDMAGIVIENCTSIILKENKMYGNGVLIDPQIKEKDASHDIDTTNEVNKKPIYYLNDLNGINPGDYDNAGQIFLVNCNDSLIKDLDVSNATIGISLLYSKNNTIFNVTASYGLGGIGLYNAYDNNISKNIIRYNGWIGIYLESSNFNNISENSINFNYIGLQLESSNNTRVIKNTFYCNYIHYLEINCQDNNIFELNIFIDCYFPEDDDDDDDNDKKREEIILGYNIIFLISILFALIGVAYIKIIKKQLK